MNYNSLIHKFSLSKRSIRSDTILISNIFSSISFFDRDRRFMYSICWSPPRFLHPSSNSHKRAPDLVLFTPYSLFDPLCFVSFFKFCLHPGALVSQLSNFSSELRVNWLRPVLECTERATAAKWKNKTLLKWSFYCVWSSGNFIVH